MFQKKDVRTILPMCSSFRFLPILTRIEGEELRLLERERHRKREISMADKKGGLRFVMRFSGLFALLLMFPGVCEGAVAMPTLGTAIPFAGVLLSIALCPLLTPALWHKHDNLILTLWSVLSLWMCSITMGPFATNHLVSAILVKEYIPFIILVGTLYIISGGISIQINREATTKANVALFLVGVIAANFIGTTGTSMLLLRPMLDMNRNRKYKVHTVIFFIFLVSNIGGCLLPFGDPPLFLGFLKGVDFFWTASHMLPLLVIVTAILITIYCAIDRYFLRKEARETEASEPAAIPENPASHPHLPLVEMRGTFNLLLMLAVVVLVAVTGTLSKKEAFSLFDTKVHYKNLIRDVGLVFISGLSLAISPKVKDKSLRKLNHFSWGPLSEVARYFVAIFITMAPVAAMLKGGHPFFQPIRLALESTMHAPFLYFWVVSPFSAFLDNAPTYLVFFKMAGGNASYLMTAGASILTAISASSVFMGAMTYIGNAPNFMVRSVAKQYGVAMPSFLGYMAWSCAILLPTMLLVSWLMFY